MPGMLPLRPPTWPPLALALLGCGGNVVVDGTGAGDGAAASNALITTMPDPGGLCTMHPDQVPAGGSFLLLASQPVTCASPDLPNVFPTNCPTGSSSPLWEVCIALQPGLVATTIDLHTYGPSANFVTNGPACSNASEGMLQFGTVAITSVTPSSATVTLLGTDSQGVEMLDSDGSYQAVRCP
jgi:hypothetical protein